jgi:hypothetical protein
MANQWIEHLKNYAKKHSISYSDAVNSEKCRDEYYKNKAKGGKESKKEKKIKEVEPVDKNKKIKIKIVKNETPIVEFL